MIKIYEVMAIEKGVPLFFHEHIERFRESISQFKIYEMDKLIKNTSELISAKLPIKCGKNIKIIYTVEDDSFNLETVDSTRPNKEVYISGAKTELFRGERKNPLIKVVNREFQSKTRAYCRDKDLYDVLLFNHLDEITEGSRSNFLLLRKTGELITSPKGDALEGITRKVLYRVCDKLGINIVHKKISISDLKESESLLLTGTSPEILPVKECGEIQFKVDSPIIEELINGFQIEKDMDYNLTSRYFNVKETRE